MSEPCTVLIAAPDLLPDLLQQTGEAQAQVLTFSDADALRALAVITKRRPRVVALERRFAATPRGAALINRIKADPTLTGSEIRVVSRDGAYTRLAPRKPADATAMPVARAAAAVADLPLDRRGTRRAPRFRIAGGVEVLVDGNAAVLVDLSIVGAQVMSSTILKPNQRVRVTLPDEKGAVRCNGAVAWASFEIPRASGPRYRAGVAFVEADQAAVGAFCAKHKA